MTSHAANLSAAELAALTRPQHSSQHDWWTDLGASVAITHNIDDVEEVWRELELSGIESPGQSLDFTKAWIETFNIPREDQLFITCVHDGRVIALLPLVRRTRMRVRMLTWFPGAHVGCNAPLIDHAAFERMTPEQQATVWEQMKKALWGVDLVRLHAIPATGEGRFFEGLGDAQQFDMLYRTVFESWEECDQVQRSRSRRKHDKQQGAKLSAMGEVTFEELSPGDPGAAEIVSMMFAQKSHRFREWGIKDPFADPCIQDFYASMFGRSGTLQAKLHVLRLNGEIVSVRYNLQHGDRLFSLVSSMSDRAELAPGSPGKQNLLRVMQSVFDEGIRVVDMGAGYSDEKRHWCNVTIPLCDHVIPLTLRGRLAARAIHAKIYVQTRIKRNARLFETVKSIRAFVGRRLGSKPQTKTEC